MKKFLMFIAAAVFSAAAMAGTPTAANNSTGTVVYGTEQALSVEKDTSSGNRVKVKYSSGTQYVADSASWTAYAKLLGGLVMPVAAPNSTSGLVYDISKTNGIYCQGGGTYSQIAWPNVGMPENITDACAFFNAAKAAAQ